MKMSTVNDLVPILYKIFSIIPGTGVLDTFVLFLTPMDYLSVRLVCSYLRANWNSTHLLVIVENVLENKLQMYGASLILLRNIFPSYPRETLDCVLSGSKILEVLRGETYIGSDVDIFVTDKDATNLFMRKTQIMQHFISNGFCPMMFYHNWVASGIDANNRSLHRYKRSVLTFVHMDSNQRILNTMCPHVNWKFLKNIKNNQNFMLLHRNIRDSLARFYHEAFKIQVILSIDSPVQTITLFDISIVQSMYYLIGRPSLSIWHENDILRRRFTGTTELYSRLENTAEEEGLHYWFQALKRFRKYERRRFIYDGPVEATTLLLYEDVIQKFDNYLRIHE